MIPQAIEFDPRSEPEELLLVRCPTCGARAGNGCVKILPHESLWDLYDAENRSTPVAVIHRGRIERAQKYHELGIRYPCHKEGCDGWRYPIDSGDMLSSSEGGCNKCDYYISAPSNCITLDEIYESMLHDNPKAAEYLDEYELYDNPKAPKHMIEIESDEPIFLTRERTKPIEYNPARRLKLKEEESLCKCGYNMHRWSNIVEESYQDRSIPCYRCGASYAS